MQLPRTTNPRRTNIVALLHKHGLRVADLARGLHRSEVDTRKKASGERPFDPYWLMDVERWLGAKLGRTIEDHELLPWHPKPKSNLRKEERFQVAKSQDEG